jgi:uncharacterized protein (DUF1330 family)
MPAYVVITREKTLDPAKLEEYKPGRARYLRAAPGHDAGESRAPGRGGRAPLEDILILKFTGCDEALAWYRSPAYQAVSETRRQGGDYRIIITEGLPLV